MEKKNAIDKRKREMSDAMKIINENAGLRAKLEEEKKKERLED
jgi:hypothetical protein